MTVTQMLLERWADLKWIDVWAVLLHVRQPSNLGGEKATAAPALRHTAR